MDNKKSVGARIAEKIPFTEERAAAKQAEKDLKSMKSQIDRTRRELQAMADI